MRVRITLVSGLNLALPYSPYYGGAFASSDLVADGILQWNYTKPFSSSTGSIQIPMEYQQKPIQINTTTYYNDRQHQGTPTQIQTVVTATMNTNILDGQITLFRSPSSWTIKRLGDIVTFTTYVKSSTIATSYNLKIQTRISSDLNFISTAPSTSYTANSAIWNLPSLANQQTANFVSVAKVVTPACNSSVNASVMLGCGSVVYYYEDISKSFFYAPGIYNLDWDQPISGALCASVSLELQEIESYSVFVKHS